jgi:hypothetical protein
MFIIIVIIYVHFWLLSWQEAVLGLNVLAGGVEARI